MDVHKILLYIVALLHITGLQAQQSYNFEDSAKWETHDTLLWSFSQDRAVSGTKSLKYSISEENFTSPENILYSIDTKFHTIMKVRTANFGGKQIIIGSDYEGNIIAVDYGGIVLWEAKTGNGTMNHDIWCADISGDGNDEIIAANANGSTYCFNHSGVEMWEFQPYEGVHRTPMYAVTVVKDAALTPYVVCGDFSCHIYYLSSSGALVKKIHSSKYSMVRAWGDVSTRPPDNASYTNFLRPIPLPDGSDLLVVHANNNHMQANGDIYLMEPLSESRYLAITDLQFSDNEVGDLRVVDPDADGKYEILFGSSSLSDIAVNRISFTDQTYKSYTIFSDNVTWPNIGVNSYRVNQYDICYTGGGDYHYVVLSSNTLFTYDKSTANVDNSNEFGERLQTAYTYNDVWSDKSGKLLLASSQDGGSCIHVINTAKEGWKEKYEGLEPGGKIARMKDNARKVREHLIGFEKPSWQREAVKVTGLEGASLPIALSLSGSSSLELYEDYWSRNRTQEPSWRSPLYDDNPFINNSDGRMDYSYTEQEIYNYFITGYTDAPGMQTWGGHGNDPLMYSLSALTRVADYGWNNGNKKTVYMFPEMNRHGVDFDFVMDNHLYPLTNHLASIGGQLALRQKDVFWQGHVYTETWEDLVSGEYASSIIPLLEETTDKTQDLSILGRMGLWAAGSVDAWGVRCSRDDPSFDRSRQFSSQKLSNHFLRKTIYSIACGASYIHNGYPDTENPGVFENHSSLVLELIAKEALFVPKTEELLSINPVHLSIVNPQESYLDEAENNKWNTYFDREEEENNPAVFSHLNGSWMGAALTPWDFSTYANATVDRRQNAVPSYPYGHVLITPVQNGAMADTDAPRGSMIDNLHPMYADIMTEYITDGVDYISADGSQRYKADEYYTQIKQDIEAGADLLPVIVSSDKVAWVVAQMSPTQLRLTLVDGPWLSPDDRIVTVKFNSVTPILVKDVLDNTVFEVSGSTAKIDVPCGMFRFIDIEISQPLN